MLRRPTSFLAWCVLVLSLFVVACGRSSLTDGGGGGSQGQGGEGGGTSCRCGDGKCQASCGENATNCPADCHDSCVCGDGHCDYGCGETALKSCPMGLLVVLAPGRSAATAAAKQPAARRARTAAPTAAA